ncbi:MAG: flavodoxin family protein [Acholeplasmatales bacterium]|nr:flavodoxin family protein [Acholeplasmatales bacterium]
MKITVINGQNHKGSSYNIGKLLASKFENAEITEFFLPRDLNHFCLGCYSCVVDESKCPVYEEKKRIMDSIEASDLLIFTTPTYCMRASAPMKAFIDLTFTYWMPHKPRASMFSKKAVVITTAAGSGTKSAIKDISNTLFYWGVPYVKGYGKAVQAMNWDMVKDEKKAKINKDIDKLAKKIMNKKNVRPGFKTKFMFNIMRMMQLKNWGSSPEEKIYWETQGWLGKGRPWK